MRSSRIVTKAWTDAERVLACSALTLPFALGWVLRLHAIARDPTTSPYVSRAFLPIDIPFLWFQVAGHALLVALALVVRRTGQARTPWLVHAEVQHWTLCASISLYTVGPFTTSFSILLLALPILGYLAFDARIMNYGLVTMATVTGVGIVLPQLGLLPYAPFFARSPVVDGFLAGPYVAAFGVPSLFVAVLVVAVHASLVRELKQRTSELERLSRTDALTGLSNRTVFFDRLAEESERSRQTGRPLCALMIDVDHFKSVNDSLGHAVGDKVLVSIAERLRESMRADDVAARYGGEEFAVILPDTGLDDAAAVADRLRQVARTIGCGEGERFRTLSVSVGVAALEDGETPDALVARADAALYASKHSGRDRVTVA